MVVVGGDLEMVVRVAMRAAGSSTEMIRKMTRKLEHSQNRWMALSWHLTPL